MLDSGMANKIYKAKQYADEPERIHIRRLNVQFDGLNSEHSVEYNNGTWSCDCGYFAHHEVCSHTMAMEAPAGSDATRTRLTRPADWAASGSVTSNNQGRSLRSGPDCFNFGFGQCIWSSGGGTRTPDTRIMIPLL